MTAEEVRRVATLALDEIAKTPPKQVFALRKGIVMAGQIMHGVYHAFRAVDGVRMEIWPTARSAYTHHKLPLDLQLRAQKMLDSF